MGVGSRIRGHVRKRPRGAVACLIVCVSGSGSGCSSEITANEGTGGDGADLTSSTLATGGAGGSGCAPKDVPGLVPDGWVEYTDWSCECRFYVPASTEAMPKPIGWEPCPQAVTDLGLQCQAMRTDWTLGETPVLEPRMYMSASGLPALAYRRQEFPVMTSVFEEIDGEVQAALIAVWDDIYPKCFLSEHGGGLDRFVVSVQDEQSTPGITGSDGALGGRIGEAPMVLARVDRTEGAAFANYYANDVWLVRNEGSLIVQPWSDPSMEIVAASATTDSEALQIADVTLHHEAVFFETTSTTRAGINVWVEAQGAAPFIRYIGDATRGAKNLGTDGVDLVWSYGEGKAPEDLFYPIRKLMAAPFTPDPTQLEPREVRDHPGDSLGNEEWVVGCGHAARTVRGGGTSTVALVRLSDGFMWELPSVPEFRVNNAVGLTCTEVFAHGVVANQFKTVRVRLDSLGVGAPP